MNKFIIIVSCCVWVIGCRTAKIDSSEPLPLVEITDEIRLQNAAQFLEGHQYDKAVSGFAYLKDNGGTFQTREKAALGLARAFLKKRQLESALGILHPLPESPYNEIQALKYALAGEAFLGKEQFDTACDMFETAAGVEPQSLKLYRAAALYNFAKCSLMRGEAVKAQQALEEAAAIFEKNGEEKRFEQCRRIATEIKEYLK